MQLAEEVSLLRNYLEADHALIDYGWHGMFRVYELLPFPEVEYAGRMVPFADVEAASDSDESDRDLMSRHFDLVKPVGAWVAMCDDVSDALGRLGFATQRSVVLGVPDSSWMSKGHQNASATASYGSHGITLDLRMSDECSLAHEWAHMLWKQLPKQGKNFIARWYRDNVFPEELLKLHRDVRYEAVVTLLTDFIVRPLPLDEAQLARYNAVAERCGTYRADPCMQRMVRLMEETQYEMRTAARLEQDDLVEWYTGALADIVAMAKEPRLVKAAYEKALVCQDLGCASWDLAHHLQSQVIGTITMRDFLKSEDCLVSKWGAIVDLIAASKIDTGGYERTFTESPAWDRLRGATMRCFDWNLSRADFNPETAEIGGSAGWKRRLRDKLAGLGVVPREYSASDASEMWADTVAFMVVDRSELSDELQQLFKAVSMGNYYDEETVARVESVVRAAGRL